MSLAGFGSRLQTIMIWFLINFTLLIFAHQGALHNFCGFVGFLRAISQLLPLQWPSAGPAGTAHFLGLSHSADALQIHFLGKSMEY